MCVVALDTTRARIPDLDGAVFGACYHPFTLAVESDARDVRRVALKGEDGIGVRRFDLVKLDSMVASCGKEALVR